MVGFEELQAFVMVVIGICALIASISGACAAVVKFWRYAHKETEQNANDISEFKRQMDGIINEFKNWFASDKRRIEALEEKQDKADEQNKLILKAMVALLEHEIDGDNHIDQLEEAKDKIQNYLIDK